MCITNSIGLFDSGVGGSSIWKEVHACLPNENTIYLADSINAPYGNKSKNEIIALSCKNTELLLQKNCKLIVVACNTATTNAIAYLRANYAVPFIGIEPAIKPAALQTKTKSVGILATRGTLASDLFHATTNLYASGVRVTEVIGEGIVPLVETGKANSKEMETLLKKFLQPMLAANIDYLVLGCTHYAYIIPKLKELLPKTVTIIDSGLAVAKQTKAVLKKNTLLNTVTKNPKLEFYSNGNPEVLYHLLEDKYRITYLDF